MKFDQTFNSQDLPEVASWAPIPDGWYRVSITGAILKPTKNGDGQYVSVSYTILGPQYEGRILFGNINIRNKNPKAQEIGLQNLNSIMRACGIVSLSDTDQLIGNNLEIKTKIQPEHDGYPASNNICGWRAIEGGTVPTPKKDNGMPSFLKH